MITRKDVIEWLQDEAARVGVLRSLRSTLLARSCQATAILLLAWELYPENASATPKNDPEEEHPS